VFGLSNLSLLSSSGRRRPFAQLAAPAAQSIFSVARSLALYTLELVVVPQSVVAVVLVLAAAVRSPNSE
jgi:hypothetical protein